MLSGQSADYVVINGWVMDAGGGYLSIMVRRDTERYLTVGTRVVVVPAEYFEPTLPCGHPGLPTDNYCGYCGRRNPTLIDGDEGGS